MGGYREESPGWGKIQPGLGGILFRAGDNPARVGGNQHGLGDSTRVMLYYIVYGSHVLSRYTYQASLYMFIRTCEYDVNVPSLFHAYRVRPSQGQSFARVEIIHHSY